MLTDEQLEDLATLLRAVAGAAASAEREACAQVCEDKAAMFSPDIDVRALTWAEASHYCATAIRVRSNVELSR